MLSEANVCCWLSTTSSHQPLLPLISRFCLRFREETLVWVKPSRACGSGRRVGSLSPHTDLDTPERVQVHLLPRRVSLLRLVLSCGRRLGGLPTLPRKINWSSHVTSLSAVLPSHGARFPPSACDASVHRHSHIRGSVSLSVTRRRRGVPLGRPLREMRVQILHGAAARTRKTIFSHTRASSDEHWIISGFLFH